MSFEKFCEATVVVICQVQSANAQQDSMFGLGLEFDDQSMDRHSMYVGGLDNRFSEDSETKERQGLLQKIDQGLAQIRGSSIYDDQSIDDAKSIVEQMDASGQPDNSPSNDLIMQTKMLLESLKNDPAMNDQEESKDERLNEQWVKLGTMIEKADEMVQHSK